ncbi:MAG TPA: molybdopterin-dependent oxidoreductase, partial [Beutenbergiaceae bacterium]|nr:molybdopterin-dependent oxidoreductase [Beutenbergiaceae bacterium]
RCILCQRCVRFQDEIAGDPFITLQGRGGGEPGREIGPLHAQQIGAFDETLLDFAPRDGQAIDTLHSDEAVGPDGDSSVISGVATTVGDAEMDSTGRPFASYFSGNTIQICPVGALTSAAYRFRSRPFDLVSSDSVAEHDSSGAAIRIDHRRGTVLRRLSGDDPVVNEEWITDKDRFAFTWQSAPDVLEAPLVRNFETGQLEPTSWSEAIHLAAQGLTKAISAGGVGLLPGGRLTLEDAYGWSKFARVVCGTNDIDFRARAHSVEELDFLGSTVAGSSIDVTFTDLENSPQVLLVGFEPEEEAGNVFLRLRKGVIQGRTQVATIAPFETRGATKMRATVLTTTPGEEALRLKSLAS